MDDHWEPWQALRARPEVELWFADLDGARGLWTRRAGRDTVYLDASLGRRERRAVLAHELVHVERGIGHGSGATVLTMAKEERLVWDEAVRRLAPPSVLDRIRRRAVDGSPVEEWEVGEELDLPPDVVRRLAALVATRGLPGATSAPHATDG